VAGTTAVRFSHEALFCSAGFVLPTGRSDNQKKETGKEMSSSPDSASLAASIIHAFAPSGVLRASINLGNPVLAAAAPDDDSATGVSVDLAKEFGRRLNVPVELVINETAGKSVQCVEDGKADIGFFAVDPSRAEKSTDLFPF
jgi:polar amino acid transport system substrate-binding protein